MVVLLYQRVNGFNQIFWDFIIFKQRKSSDLEDLKDRLWDLIWIWRDVNEMLWDVTWIKERIWLGFVLVCLNMGMCRRHMMAKKTGDQLEKIVVSYVFNMRGVPWISDQLQRNLMISQWIMIMGPGISLSACSHKAVWILNNAGENARYIVYM